MQTMIALFWLSVISAVQCLDSNIIHSSREMTNSQESDTVANSHNSVRRTSGLQGIRETSQECTSFQAPECKGSRKKQQNAAKTKIQLDGRGSQKVVIFPDSNIVLTKIRPTTGPCGIVPEMSPCVRSGDCEEGLCCALYLTGRRCQRVPALGEVCLLRGRAKFRRRLDRCDCEKSLSCRALPDGPRGQGVCHPNQRS